MDAFVRHSRETAQQDSYDELTDREREVLQLIAEGRTNRQIAELLGMSVRTVEVHKAHVLRKLGLRGTAALTGYGIRKGIISVDQC